MKAQTVAYLPGALALFKIYFMYFLNPSLTIKTSLILFKIKYAQN
jgi:hypothetical protein